MNLNTLIYLGIAGVIFLLLLSYIGVIPMTIMLSDGIAIFLSAIVALAVAPVILVMGLLGSFLGFMVLLSILCGLIVLVSIITIAIIEWFE